MSIFAILIFTTLPEKGVISEVSTDKWKMLYKWKYKKNLIEYKIRKCFSSVLGNNKWKHGFTPFLATCEQPTLKEK